MHAASGEYDEGRGAGRRWEEEREGEEGRRELTSTWHRSHLGFVASVNSVAWAPYEHGPILACASSDSKVSIVTFNSTSPFPPSFTSNPNPLVRSHLLPSFLRELTLLPPSLPSHPVPFLPSPSLSSSYFFLDDGSTESFVAIAHPMGATSVSWAPSVVPGSLTRPAAPVPGGVSGSGPEKQKKFVTGGCDSKVKIWGWR